MCVDKHVGQTTPICRLMSETDSSLQMFCVFDDVCFFIIDTYIKYFEQKVHATNSTINSNQIEKNDNLITICVVRMVHLRTL